MQDIFAQVILSRYLRACSEIPDRLFVLVLVVLLVLENEGNIEDEDENDDEDETRNRFSVHALRLDIEPRMAQFSADAMEKWLWARPGFCAGCPQVCSEGRQLV